MKTRKAYTRVPCSQWWPSYSPGPAGQVSPEDDTVTVLLHRPGRLLFSVFASNTSHGRSSRVNESVWDF